MIVLMRFVGQGVTTVHLASQTSALANLTFSGYNMIHPRDQEVVDRMTAEGYHFAVVGNHFILTMPDDTEHKFPTFATLRQHLQDTEQWLTTTK
jgi:hypothetical protein